MTAPSPLAELILEKFVSRTDVKAIQRSDGSYNPIETEFTAADVQDHLDGTKTYGHYVLGTDSTCKVITFDCDLEKTGFWVEPILPEEIIAIEEACGDDFTSVNAAYLALEKQNVHYAHDLRGLWIDTKNKVAREALKLQMRTLAETLSSRIHSLLDIPVASAYSGHKGVHVYAFLPQPMAGDDARLIANDVMESFGYFSATRGENFWKDTRPVAETTATFSNFSIEVFPKQAEIEEGKFGNLVRLPLGRNQKTRHPTFFLDQSTAHVKLTPHGDPAALLTSGNPWL